MSLAPPVVFDTASLWNFAAIERLDILEVRYGTRASWTDTVKDEVRNGEPWEPLLGALHECSWLGSPIELQSLDCLKTVTEIQRILAAPGDPPSRHLGEAECMHVIEHELKGNGFLVTDDGAAADLARRRGIRVFSTRDVIEECYAMYELRCPEPFELLEAMSKAGRGNVRVPESHRDICP